MDDQKFVGVASAAIIVFPAFTNPALAEGAGVINIVA